MELCVNYKAKEANWAADAAYFKSIGVTGIRPHLPAIGSPWADVPDSEGNLHWWRRCAKYFSDNGFYVIWGLAGYNGFNTAGTLTATRFAEYRNIVLGEAGRLRDLGMTIDFEIGNEMESTADGATLTVDQLQVNLGILATDVKAIYKGGKISYSPWDYAGTTYDKWISNGKGGLDLINVHPYCNTVNARAVTQGGYQSVAKMMHKFGDSCYATEFGMEAGSDNVLALPTDLKRSKIIEMWNYCNNLGMKKAFVFQWVGYLNGDDQWAMKKMDGTFDLQWPAYLAKGKRYPRSY